MAIITGGIIGTFSATIDFLTYFWLPQHMGSHIEPLSMDSSAVSIMSHMLGFSPRTLQEFWTLHALFWGLVNGAIPALAVGLYCGWAAYVQHFVLRLLLWWGRLIPFNYAHFLDYAAERILLRKVGGGYIFVHRLLLEYFASLEEMQNLRNSPSMQHHFNGRDHHHHQKDRAQDSIAQVSQEMSTNQCSDENAQSNGSSKQRENVTPREL